VDRVLTEKDVGRVFKVLVYEAAGIGVAGCRDGSEASHVLAQLDYEMRCLLGALCQ
jgi:hypothetical protein